MTSEEIKAIITDLKRSDLAEESIQPNAPGIWEIAYQLAVMNERVYDFKLSDSQPGKRDAEVERGKHSFERHHYAGSASDGIHCMKCFKTPDELAPLEPCSGLSDPEPGKRDAEVERGGMGDFPSPPETFTKAMGDLYVEASNLTLQKAQGTLLDSHWARLSVAIIAASHAARILQHSRVSEPSSETGSTTQKDPKGRT